MLFFKQRQQAMAMSIEEGLLLKKKEPSICLLDVRTPKEYASKHLPESINLPLQQMETVHAIIPDLQTRILVYCQSGSRSRRAAIALKKYGYEQVTDLGGIMHWNGKMVR
ncbi:rhodanese-like domain-containing protein [[Clostridium] innocuum]|nr:rhodanese-like domain-containing protein [Erysipelotrichaceae bacterium]MCR0381333.1 rhodanese-like domain-containing protein [[Clostridium] innocuum]MCR0412687.1 rhodanese-like domain-containing protein [[Clostridium] innocuum]MCR0535452.1 rhodanese-like domain-containing protein [[Clostridium] innocuum]MCR0539688.1 rhodanese-like domain-containing protein [[Clostridium] innocuum]